MHPFTPRQRDSVAALGETRLIESIRRWLGNVSPPPPFGIGDDCAVLPASRRRQLVTTDPVIFGRHFDDSVPPCAVGAKLLKRNLSDLAAMGARPTAAVVSLALDPRVSTRWLEQFHRGLAAVARRFSVAVVGGDVAQSDGFLGAFLTLFGEAAARGSCCAPGRGLATGSTSPARWAAACSATTGGSSRGWPRANGCRGATRCAR